MEIIFIKRKCARQIILLTSVTGTAANTKKLPAYDMLIVHEHRSGILRLWFFFWHGVSGAGACEDNLGKQPGK